MRFYFHQIQVCLLTDCCVILPCQQKKSMLWKMLLKVSSTSSAYLLSTFLVLGNQVHLPNLCLPEIQRVSNLSVWAILLVLAKISFCLFDRHSQSRLVRLSIWRLQTPLIPHYRLAGQNPRRKKGSRMRRKDTLWSSDQQKIQNGVAVTLVLSLWTHILLWVWNRWLCIGHELWLPMRVEMVNLKTWTIM